MTGTVSEIWEFFKIVEFPIVLNNPGLMHDSTKKRPGRVSRGVSSLSSRVE
jgi:hypothetical protein